MCVSDKEVECREELGGRQGQKQSWELLNKINVYWPVTGTKCIDDQEAKKLYWINHERQAE